MESAPKCLFPSVTYKGGHEDWRSCMNLQG